MGSTRPRRGWGTSSDEELLKGRCGTFTGPFLVSAEQSRSGSPAAVAGKAKASRSKAAKFHAPAAVSKTSHAGRGFGFKGAGFT